MDIIYLGIFAILSPSFDDRFYRKTPPNLLEEFANAVLHFHSLLHVFSQRFIILLEGELISHSYIVNRMLGEFAAAAVVFAKAAHGFLGKDDNGREYGVSTSDFVEAVEGILQESYPKVFPYYSWCLDRGHKHFIWTGPELQIFPQSEDFNSMAPLTETGELLDIPRHQIYCEIPDRSLSQSPITVAESRKHCHDTDLANDRPEKRRRQPRSGEFFYRFMNLDAGMFLYLFSICFFNCFFNFYFCI